MLIRSRYLRSGLLWVAIFGLACLTIHALFFTLKQKYSPIRERMCNRCFPHDFKYVINNENICNNKGSKVAIELMIIIFTRHGNYRARDAIRNTWLTYTKNNTANVRYAFLLGKTENYSDYENIIQENSVYRDILKEDFLDDYKNLTYKTIMGFKWTLRYCSWAQVLLKTDDDMFINIPKLLSFLKHSKEMLLENVVGSCVENGSPQRNVNSKWYASEEIYKEKRYPGFCSGTGYLTSLELVKKIYNISQSVPFFYLEDVYVGLCLYKVGGGVKDVHGFKIHIPYEDPCAYKKNNLFTAHQVKPEMLYTIWKSQCNNAERQQFSWISLFSLLTFCTYSINGIVIMKS